MSDVSLEQELLVAFKNKKPEDDKITLELSKEKLLAISGDKIKDLGPELLPDTISIDISMRELMKMIKEANPNILRDIFIDIQLGK